MSEEINEQNEKFCGQKVDGTYIRCFAASKFCNVGCVARITKDSGGVLKYFCAYPTIMGGRPELEIGLVDALGRDMYGAFFIPGPHRENRRNLKYSNTTADAINGTKYEVEKTVEGSIIHYKFKKKLERQIDQIIESGTPLPDKYAVALKKIEKKSKDRARKKQDGSES